MFCSLVKIEKLVNQKESHLVLFFTGWSCHPSQFDLLRFSGCDLWVVYDYTSLEFPLPDISAYSKVSVLGWSFGVWAATYCLPSLPPLHNSVAVAGSILPVDVKYGISPKAFNLTVASIEKVGIDKFNERMVGENIGCFHPSPRSLEDVVAELKALKSHFEEHNLKPVKWNYAVVCKDDAIFPFDNLYEFWRKNTNFVTLKVDMPHFIFDCRGEVMVDGLINMVI